MQQPLLALQRMGPHRTESAFCLAVALDVMIGSGMLHGDRSTEERFRNNQDGQHDFRKGIQESAVISVQHSPGPHLADTSFHRRSNHSGRGVDLSSPSGQGVSILEDLSTEMGSS